MCYTALGGVYGSPSKLFLAYVFACNCLDHSRTCEEHIGDSFGHDGEVGQRRAVDGAACARAEDCGNLRHNAGSEDIALKYFCVSGKSVYAFLDAGSA